MPEADYGRAWRAFRASLPVAPENNALLEIMRAHLTEGRRRGLFPVDEDGWGLVGDGIADETDALQATLDAHAVGHRPLILREQTYLLSAPAQVIGSHVAIIGCRFPEHIDGGGADG